MPNVPLSAHIAAASINQTVGDWAGNQRRIEEVLAACRERGVRFVLLPEMVIPGYSLGDRLLMRGTLARSWAMLEALRPATRGLVALVGLPVHHRDVLYNAVAVVANGDIVGIVPKENLATGDVQYENRWFSGWPRARIEPFTPPNGSDDIPMGGLLFDAKGIGRFGIEICEDGWKGLRPGSVYALSGAHIVANPSASWFTLGKHAVRKHMVTQISREDHLVYLYTSLLGCDATRLIFDGSVFLACDGQVLEEGRRFRFGQDWELVDRIVDLAALERARMEEGSWRQQVDAMQRGDFGEVPPVIDIAGDFTTADPAPARPPYWQADTDEPHPDPSLAWLDDVLGRRPSGRDIPHLELELALALGLSEYSRKCGVKAFTVALSGGRDSTMCALLVARMVRYEMPDASPEEVKAVVNQRLLTAYMGTDNSGSATRNAARGFSEEVGARHFEAAVQSAVDTHLDLFDQMTGTRLSWDDRAHDVPLQNVQARLRGSLIWMVANVYNTLLLSTSNKSEAAVGYATMDGDTSGGLSPIADVPKSLVQLWLEWAAQFHDLDSIRAVIATPATAELRPPEEGQTDEDDLMPFVVLDQLMYAFVQLGQDPLQMFRTLWPAVSDHPRYASGPAAFAADIRKFVKLLCRAQWKRERFAISFRVTAFDLDPKTGFRFPPVQAPFTEELAELDRYVATL